MPHAQDFDYMKSNRFEIDKDTSSVCVQSCGAEVLYGYDYQGLSPRAVITPQSERCTISFVHALTACMCGALVGAADAGKSTSVTEIGKLLGTGAFSEVRLAVRSDAAADTKESEQFALKIFHKRSWKDSFSRKQLRQRHEEHVH